MSALVSEENFRLDHADYTSEVDEYHTNVVNANTEEITSGSQTPLLFRTIRMLLENARRGARLLDLRDRGYLPKYPPQSTDGATAVDVFRVMVILKLNAFNSSTLCASDVPNVNARNIGLTAVWITASHINHA
ncbi:hypothetical protein LTR37_001399 [Vermiconidia calcicola]|uniref:Uncharacterized protein n=1 Tax=Vermiconidia calcicola TaxID=1690605 RepID=A0ACC3NW08_9PEZI|nr:hypothetical protein LTR37_001399 [Vermiconidia calcicola]